MSQVLFARQGNSRWGHFDNLRAQLFIQGSIVDFSKQVIFSVHVTCLTLKMTILIVKLFKNAKFFNPGQALLSFLSIVF